MLFRRVHVVCLDVYFFQENHTLVYGKFTLKGGETRKK